MSKGQENAPFMVTAAAALLGIGAASLFNLNSNQRKERKYRRGKLLSSLEELDDEKGGVDAILVVGGGRPRSRTLPTPWVVSRCDLAAQAFNSLKKDELQILTLSAGTAHVPQLLNHRGLPVWESESSALYLIDHHGISTRQVKMETSSYDTIGNAYFARTSFCDVYTWKKLLIITSEFHMPRCRAIFDWIFNVPSAKDGPKPGYKLFFIASPNTGLSQEIVEARKGHEEKGRRRVNNLARNLSTLPKVLDFLTIEHGMYKVPWECLESLPESLQRPDAIRIPNSREPSVNASLKSPVSSTRSDSQTVAKNSDFSITDLIKASYAVVEASPESLDLGFVKENPPAGAREESPEEVHLPDPSLSPPRPAKPGHSRSETTL